MEAMDRIKRLTYVNGFKLDGVPLTEMEVVDKFNEAMTQNYKLKTGTVKHYENEIKKIKELS